MAKAATQYDEFVCSYTGSLLAGVDEAGRGPLAGDVVAGAVILDPQNPIEGLADSKKLTDRKRELLFDEIREKALAWAVGRATVTEIDELNILHASMLAMHRAVQALAVQPEYILVDGNRLPVWDYKAEAVVKGDLRVQCISAGSIIAKVTRDREMLELAEQYPQYGFEKHKAYPTKAHMELLQKFGPAPCHRKSFGPVKRLLES